MLLVVLWILITIVLIVEGILLENIAMIIFGAGSVFVMLCLGDIHLKQYPEVKKKIAEKIRAQKIKYIVCLLSAAIIVGGIFTFINSSMFRFREYNFKITDYNNNIIIDRKDFESVYEKEEDYLIEYTIHLTYDGQQKLKEATKSISKQNDSNNQMLIYHNNNLLFSEKITSEIDTEKFYIRVNK